jgi:adenylate cyclase, class 2
VSTETEVKIKIGDPAYFCGRLEALNPVRLSARHFEDNRLLDFPNKSLHRNQHLVRIRTIEGRGILTYKGPPRPDGMFKTRVELETGLENADLALQIFEQIGMKVYFQYQKYRQEFEIDGVYVVVDETPIGNYVELEGAKEAIRSLAHKLGFEESQFVSLSYYTLYLEHCRNIGTTPHFMVFRDSELPG